MPQSSKIIMGDQSQVAWTILVASQDEAIQQVVTAVLRGSGSKIIAARSLRIFFEQLAGSGVDFIVYDLDLEPLNAIDAFAIEKLYHPRIPAVLIYGALENGATPAVLDRGVIFRMIKPVNIQDLKRILETARRHKARSRNQSNFF